MNEGSAELGSREQLIAHRLISLTNQGARKPSPQENQSNDYRLNLHDEKLYQVIKKILYQGGDDQNRKRAIDSLLELTLKLNGIRKHSSKKINYQEALNLALENVWLNITNFPKIFELDIDNSDASYIRQCFVKWFNKILQRRISDLYREIKRQPISLEKLPQKVANIGTTNNELDQIANQEWVDKLKDYLNRDPDGILQRHPKETPKCSCQELIKRRLLSEPSEKWQTIAEDLNLPQGTVTAFWHRQCMPLLQEIAQKLV